MSARARSQGSVQHHALLLAFFSAVIGASLIMSADAQVASVFGWDLPPLCVWTNLFGRECPGCGLTRSFVHTAHGDLWGGFALNKMGPVLWVLAAAQLPYQGLKLWRAARASKVSSHRT